jgi:hypothetical protein
VRTHWKKAAARVTMIHMGLAWRGARARSRAVLDRGAQNFLKR